MTGPAREGGPGSDLRKAVDTVWPKESDPALYQELINRMRRIEGQVRGVQRLLEEGADCDAIATQIAAVKAALGAVGLKLVACQLSQSVAAEIAAGKDGREAADTMMKTLLRLR